MLAVGCGSAAASAWRAPAIAAWAGLAWVGAAGTSPQKPRALMMSAGVCGLASALPTVVLASGFVFAGWTIWASAEASCSVAAAGFARGTGTGSADLAETAAANWTAGLP